MKRIAQFIVLLICAGLVRGQSNPPAVGPEAPLSVPVEAHAVDADAEVAPADAEGVLTETHIFSDTVELGMKSRTAVYRGNVRLSDPRLHLTCEQLAADVPEAGSRVHNVVAETNVVLVMIDDQGRTNRAYADKAVYRYAVVEGRTNEVVELSGETQPRIERAEGVLYGDVIVWDRIRDQIHATHQRMIYRADPSSLTNVLPAAATNRLDAGAVPDGDPDRSEVSADE